MVRHYFFTFESIIISPIESALFIQNLHIDHISLYLECKNKKTEINFPILAFPVATEINFQLLVPWWLSLSKPLPSLAFFVVVSMLRQAQQPQAQRPLQQVPTTILPKKWLKTDT